MEHAVLQDRAVVIIGGTWGAAKASVRAGASALQAAVNAAIALG
jgi:hypothetical protein